MTVELADLAPGTLNGIVTVVGDPSTDEKRREIDMWAHDIDALDKDSGHLRISDQRLLAFVIRDQVGVILTNAASKPEQMAARRYRPAIVWAAADRALRMKTRRADDLAVRACAFLGLDRIEEDELAFLDEAYRLAKRGQRRFR